MSTSTPDNAADPRAASAEELRPLPDGGLGDAMPEWLRRPPAWRNLPAKPAPEKARELPEPDTSVIDPRTLIEVADLPPWLQAIAARGEERTGGESTPEEPSMASNRDDAETPSTEPRQVQFEPVDKKRWEIPEGERTEILGGPNKTTGGRVGGSPMIMLAGLVALVIILILLFIFVF